MLVISRDLKKSKIILSLPTDPIRLAALAGAELVLIYLGLCKGTVRIGIEADRSVGVFRLDEPVPDLEKLTYEA